VWSEVIANGRFLITQDLDFSDIRKYPPGTHPGILLLRLSHPSLANILSRVEELLINENIDDWQGCLVVITENQIRVRRS
jgi:predicted nuclease of predicted toxin-antitoxin system